MTKDQRYWPLFLAVPGIGRQTLLKILKLSQLHGLTLAQVWRSKQPPNFFNLSPRQRDGIKLLKKKYSLSSYAQMLAEQEISLIAYGDINYPFLLKQIDDPPLLLYTKGRNLLVKETINRAVAVVGTRQITEYGKVATSKIVSELVDLDLLIVSGFMYGVDLQAHLQAIKKQGKTIGVLGYGFNYCYPKSISSFREYFLAQGGMLISEFAPDVAVRPENFPIRNRIVAGLSLGVVVIEAGLKSGSHITAGCALDGGRTVFALPGSIFSQFSEGTKWLVNQGAVLVSSGQDIWDNLRNELN